MLRIGISGICGKMGRRIASIATKDSEIEIAVALEREGMSEVGKSLESVTGIPSGEVLITSDPVKAAADMECLIEFTLPEPTLEHLEICRGAGTSMVIGTTGLDPEGEEKIREAAGTIPIVFSPNMSVGVNLFFNIVREAARILGEEFDMEIDETHHVHKKDSPSGTAKMIARIVKEVTGKEAPVKAFREGEVIGNHGIVFDGEYEKLEFRHDAKTRDVFASGAVKAAKFLSGKKPGLYSMADVLGLNSK